MKITVTTENFLAALSDVKRVAPSETVNIVADKKSVTLTASSTGATIVVLVEGAKVGDKGHCSVPVATLEGVLKKRKDVVFELDGEELKFKAGTATGYAGKLTTVPYQEVKIGKEESPLKMDEETLAKISEVIASVTLTSVNLKKQDILPICMKFSPDGIEASCASRNHMAYAHHKKKTFKKTQEFCIEPSIIPIIEAVSKKATYSLAVTDNSVYAENERFQIRFVTQQFDRFVKLEVVKGFLKGREKAEATIKTKTDDITATFQNMISLYEQNSFIEVVCKDGKLKVSTKTKFGACSENVPGEMKGSFKKPYGVHPKVFEDIMNKCKANTIKLGFHGGVSISMEQSKNDTTYVYSCSTSKL